MQISPRPENSTTVRSLPDKVRSALDEVRRASARARRVAPAWASRLLPGERPPHDDADGARPGRWVQTWTWAPDPSPAGEAPTANAPFDETLDGELFLRDTRWS